MHIARPHPLTETEYLAAESASPIRHEFVAGEVYDMTGGSQRHNRISGNIFIALSLALKGKPCQVFISDVKLRVAQANAYYYPDVMVACADQATAANDAQVVEDPVLVLEVLSPGTEATDRREKLTAYRKLPSLREYVLVSQDRRQVEVYRRQAEGVQVGGWLYVTFEPEDTVSLESVAVEMAMGDLYLGTDVVA